VSTSNLSHFSRPIIEAWAQKKSVIASDTEHSQNLIVDHFDGLLYENMNTFDLQNRIVEVMYNPALNEKLGENGYRKAVRLFHEDNTSDLIIKYLATIDK
jgi:glycosyltransferase involved in cell wall biosynthesis